VLVIFMSDSVDGVIQSSRLKNGVVGGGLFDLKSAQFEGELGNLANSKVAISLNGTFLNKDVNISFGFDFNDVEGSVLKLVRMLTHNNYNQGKASEFIVGNRP
jgi:hypothetical protein